MTRGSSLSDAKVIETVNRDFVPLEINLTRTSFPDPLPALSLWKKAFLKNPKARFGFSTTVVITPDGKTPLGTSGCGHVWEWNSSPNYKADLFVGYLRETRKRHARLKGILATENLVTKAAELGEMKEEILSRLSAANRCEKPAGR